MAASTEKINYKVLFAKLHTRVDKEVQPKTFYPSVKQYPLLNMGVLRTFLIFQGLLPLKRFSSSSVPRGTDKLNLFISTEQIRVQDIVRYSLTSII
jgi:hypothetical protein